MFHKVVWQHMQGTVGFLITILLQIYQRIFPWQKKILNRLRFGGIMAMSLWLHFFSQPYTFIFVYEFTTGHQGDISS